MPRTAHRLDGGTALLGAISLAAWAGLALAGTDAVALPVLCSAATGWAAALAAPAKLAFSWALMVAAMMSPLVAAPLRHVRDRSFARRRARAMLLFGTGYMTVWMGAGIWLQGMALAARSVAPAPLATLGLAALVVLAWQVSPAKQWCLNRCHQRPALAAFGAAADRNALGFGLASGTACVGSCWALMLLPFLMENGHLLVMAAVALFLFAERLDRTAPPSWRWRAPRKAVRIAMVQVRIGLARAGPHRGDRAAKRAAQLGAAVRRVIRRWERQMEQASAAPP